MRTSGRSGSRENATDLYLTTILLIFPLFPGFSGYLNITFSKYVFFLSATGLWLTALMILSIRKRRGFGRPGGSQAAALVFLAVCALSCLCSPWPLDSLLGAGRFDGLLTLACQVLLFLGVSRFTRPKPLHAAAFAVGVTACCAVGVLQLLGLDPLRLFPEGLCYYDGGTLYSGAYLGTIGNTNILDAVLCAALPLCFTVYVREGQAPYLLPLLPACFIEAFSGGSGALVAYAVCALAAMPLLTDAPRLRRGLRAAAAVLCPAGLALAYSPDYVDRILAPRFAWTPASCAVVGGAAVLLAVSLLPWGRFAPSARTLRRLFLGLDAALVLGGLAAVWSWPGTSGTLYELREALRGHLEDGYGSSRVRIWRRCLALAAERPLLGGGPGTLALRAGIEFSRYVPETGSTLSSFVDNAHNIYLGYLVNCGILGLAAYLSLLLCAARDAWRARRGPMTAALALSTLCAAVHGLFGLGLFLSEPFFWAVLGLLCSRGSAGEELT